MRIEVLKYICLEKRFIYIVILKRVATTEIEWGPASLNKDNHSSCDRGSSLAIGIPNYLTRHIITPPIENVRE